MMKKIFFTLLGLSLLTGFTAEAAEGVQVKKIHDSAYGWDGKVLPHYGTNQPALKVVHFTIEPGVQTVTHVHPYNGAGYILKGELTMYVTQSPNGDFSDSQDVKKITLGPGETWNETVNKWHYGVNNGTEPVEFIVVFAGEEGVPPTLHSGH